MFQKIGVLTSGGDAPGMNAAVRAVVSWLKADVAAKSRLSTRSKVALLRPAVAADDRLVHSPTLPSSRESAHLLRRVHTETITLRTRRVLLLLV